MNKKDKSWLLNKLYCFYWHFACSSICAMLGFGVFWWVMTNDGVIQWGVFAATFVSAFFYPVLVAISDRRFKE